MIKSIKVTNHLGESILLELRFPERSGFLIRGINGLGPSKANVNITEIATGDGAMFNSSRVTSRNVVLMLTFLEKPTIEDVRLLSYKYFPIKKRITMEIETGNRISTVVGYVESNEPNIFSNQEGTSISIVCPDAYFYDIEQQVTTFTDNVSMFEFPFSNESLTDNLLIISDAQKNLTKTVTYFGDASVGLIIYLHATSTVRDITIYNLTTSETMTLNVTMAAGDDIIISTVKGNKFIIMQHEGVLSNILNTRAAYSRWFQIDKGDNIFTYTAVEGELDLTFRIENQVAYEGI